MFNLVLVPLLGGIQGVGLGARKTPVLADGYIAQAHDADQWMFLTLVISLTFSGLLVQIVVVLYIGLVA